MGPIVTAATAAALPRNATIVHVEAGEPDAARTAFEAGHLPGARLVDRDRLTAAPIGPGDGRHGPESGRHGPESGRHGPESGRHGPESGRHGPESGRHPLPTPEDFAAALGAAGIGAEDVVLAYDREHGASAGRLVYLLRILGQPAALLDGGLDGWTEALETGPPPTVAPVSCPVRPWPTDALVDAEGVQAHLDAGGVVLDARAAERYRGEVEPLDPVAGHIPGAVSAPFGDNLDAKGNFKSPPRLWDRYQPMGVDADAIAYCGSGVTACHDLLAIEHAGLGLPRLYVGSWSHWITDPDRPRAVGAG